MTPPCPQCRSRADVYLQSALTADLRVVWEWHCQPCRETWPAVDRNPDRVSLVEHEPEPEP